MSACPDTTLLDVASDPSCTNVQQARAYIVAQGDRLWLLLYFMQCIGRQCAAYCAAHPDAMVVPERDSAAATAPLLDLLLWRPRVIYQYNDAILRIIPAQMPGVPRGLFEQLQLWNRVLWSCPHLPPAVASFVFWWMACAHRGIAIMVADTHDVGAWWVQEDRFDHLLDFVNEYITRISNHNVAEATYRAVRMHAALCLAVPQRDLASVLADGTHHTKRVPKGNKGAILAAYRQQQQELAQRATLTTK